VARAVEDQVVVVTGASSGVRRAVACAFGKRDAGWLARNEEALRAAAAGVQRAGGDAIVFPVDVVDADAVEHAAELIEQRFGRINTWVNCAMVTAFASALQMTPE
jgi:NAD(P)-dependent dehydrogenase (short-subunit alcohol dehydrogenase family)